MLREDLRLKRCAIGTQSKFLAMAAVLTVLLGRAQAGAADAEAEPSVIRVATADGTLIVRVDDPNVSVRVEGSELVVTGAGLQELRVGTGDLRADSNEGTPETVVSITRGDKEILNIRREASVAKAAAIITRGNTPSAALRSRIAAILRNRQQANQAAPPAHPASKRVHNPDTDHDYQRINVPMTWQEAKEYCERWLLKVGRQVGFFISCEQTWSGWGCTW